VKLVTVVVAQLEAGSVAVTVIDFAPAPPRFVIEFVVAGPAAERVTPDAVHV
jgi:hypothetical protein